MPDRRDNMMKKMKIMCFNNSLTMDKKWNELMDFDNLPSSSTVVLVCMYELSLKPNKGVMICLCCLVPCEGHHRTHRTRSNWKMQYLDVQQGERPEPWTQSQIFDLLKRRGGCEARLVWDSTRCSLMSKCDNKYIAVREQDKGDSTHRPPLGAVNDPIKLVFKKTPENRGVNIFCYEKFDDDAFLIGNARCGMQTNLHGGCSYGNMAFTTSDEKWRLPFFLLAFDGDAVSRPEIDLESSKCAEVKVNKAMKEKMVSKLKCVKNCRQSERHLPKEKNEPFLLFARVPRLSELVWMIPTPKGIRYNFTNASNVSDLLELKLQDPDERLLWTAHKETDGCFKLYSKQDDTYLYWRQKDLNGGREKPYQMKQSFEATVFEGRRKRPDGGFEIYANEDSRKDKNVACSLQGQIRKRENRGLLPTVSQKNGRPGTTWYALAPSEFNRTSTRGLLVATQHPSIAQMKKRRLSTSCRKRASSGRWSQNGGQEYLFSSLA